MAAEQGLLAYNLGALNEIFCLLVIRGLSLRSARDHHHGLSEHENVILQRGRDEANCR